MISLHLIRMHSVFGTCKKMISTVDVFMNAITLISKHISLMKRIHKTHKNCAQEVFRCLCVVVNEVLRTNEQGKLLETTGKRTNN